MKLPCSINYYAQHTYSLTLEFLAYDFPPIFVLLSYIVIFAKIFQRSLRSLRKRVLPVGGMTITFTLATQHNSSTAGSNDIVPLPVNANSLKKPALPVNTSSTQTTESKMYKLFALLALCVLICFIPAMIYYLAVDFNDYWNDTLFAVVTCLQYGSCALNPLIYHSSLPGIQRAIKNIFVKKSPN
ncbi:uncharacterized protein LOC129584452 [Paramacrobiotus metropolitanus]|uniref:uncharacterized protein LOC129584452 n=1 Tax=Paramacrobiotus metropolitanus TaxID=2943436 RepID=UPI0024461855|nr:uncharacterized protein LOC129584452 [Paramacrobiotus metropolitanus]